MPEALKYRSWRRTMKREAGKPGAQSESPPAAEPLSPLDFAESVIRDPAQPMALRASMAKAALPYVHGRWCPLGADPRDTIAARAEHTYARPIPPKPHIAAREAGRAPGESEATVADTAVEAVPDQLYTVSPCSASGTSQMHASPARDIAPPAPAWPPAPPPRVSVPAATDVGFTRLPAKTDVGFTRLQAKTDAGCTRLPANMRAMMPTIDPMFADERIVQEAWPDEIAPRRAPLPDRANRSQREAEADERRWR